MARPAVDVTTRRVSQRVECPTIPEDGSRSTSRARRLRTSRPAIAAMAPPENAAGDDSSPTQNQAHFDVGVQPLAWRLRLLAHSVGEVEFGRAFGTGRLR